MPDLTRRKLLNKLGVASIGTLVPFVAGNVLAQIPPGPKGLEGIHSVQKTGNGWNVGIGRRKITPTTSVWLAGYGRQRVPYEKIHDLFVKVMALKDTDGKIVVLVTTDNQGMSHTVYESIFQKIHQRFGLERKNFMLTFSHKLCRQRQRWMTFRSGLII